MYAQLTFFDCPRGPEALAAADFAVRERIVPAIDGLGLLVHVYQLRRPDGTEVVVSIAESEDVLIDAQKAIMNTQLLPEEDAALLPGPDRIEMYPVLREYGGTADER